MSCVLLDITVAVLDNACRIAAAGWQKNMKPPNAMAGLHTRSYTVQEALRKHFWITTSGMFSQAGLSHALDVMGVDRVLFSIDYPFEDAVEASAWFDAAVAGMNPSVARQVAYGNAAKLLGIQ